MLYFKVVREQYDIEGGVYRETLIVCESCSSVYTTNNVISVKKIGFSPTARINCERCGRLGNKSTHHEKF